MNNKAEKGSIPELEMTILSVLWDQSQGATVKEILENWDNEDKPGYTTVLKKLQVMETKGLVSHRPDGKAYRYLAAVAKDAVSETRFARLLKNLFSGNRMDMALAFIRDTDFTEEELKAVKAMLDEKTEDSNHG